MLAVNIHMCKMKNEMPDQDVEEVHKATVVVFILIACELLRGLAARPSGFL